MKNNINKKIGATLLTTAIMAGTAVIPMSNAAVEQAATETKVPTIKYSAHVQNEGWMAEVSNGEIAGTFYKSQRVEALKIKLENCDNVTLKVKLHIQDYGDREFTVTAADADKIIGTQWEAKRIEAMTITTEGLSELGYKLQYRVHVQNIGWQDWKDEGEMAGTQWKKLRLEAVQMRIVVDEEAMAAKELKEAKEEAISTLTKYSDLLPAMISQSTARDRLKEEITSTLADVKAATDKASVEELFNEQVKRIEKITSPYTVEEKVKEAEEELAEAVEAINETISDYEEYIAQAPSTELKANDKSRLNAIIADTKTKIANAKTAADIATIADDLSDLTDSFNLDSKVEAYNDLKDAQENANKKIAIYESAVEESSYTASYKKLANASIATAKSEVAAAKSDDEVKTAIDKLDATLSSNQFKEIAEIAEEAIAQNEIDTAIAEAEKVLVEYTTCGYEEVEELATEYIAKMKKLTTVADIEATVDSSDDSYATLLAAEKAKAKKAKDDYETAKKATLVRLNATLAAIDELDLSDSDVESITKMINLTKAKIESVATDDDVDAAETVFNNYMAKYYADIQEDVDTYKFDEIKANALATLAEYTDSSIEEVKTLAKNAKSYIERIKTAEDNAIEGENTDKISKKLTETVSSIELAIAKNDAKTLANSLTNELKSYTGTTNLAKVRVTANNAINTIAGELTTANDASGATALSTIDTCLYNMKKAKKDAITAINKIISENAEKVETELKAVKDKALAEIDSYIALAEDLENWDLVDSLETYRDFVSGATKVSEINNVVAFESDDTLTEDCLLSKLVAETSLAERVDAIKTIEAAYLAAYADADGNVTNTAVKNDKTLAAKIKALIAEVKDPKTTTGVGGRIEAILANDTGDLAVAISTTTSNYAALEEAKTTAKAKINATAVSDYNTSALKLVIKDYTDEIDAITSTKDYQDSIDAIVAKALVRVENELKTVLEDYADEQLKANDVTDDNTVSAAITTNLTSAADKSTTDNLLTAAGTTKSAIDSAIKTLVDAKE